jgi:hypothetical protein
MVAMKAASRERLTIDDSSSIVTGHKTRRVAYPAGFSRFWDAAFVPGTSCSRTAPGTTRHQESDELLNGADMRARPVDVNR